MLNRWQSTIVDAQGNVQPLANLTVRNETDQSLAKMWASPGTTQPLPDGMVQADGNGYAFFYARGGLYRITSATLGIDWRHVPLGNLATMDESDLGLGDLATMDVIDLGLGTAATRDVGTVAGTVAAGDDSRITGAMQKSSNLNDVANKATARDNLGLGSAATMDAVSSDTDTSGGNKLVTQDWVDMNSSQGLGVGQTWQDVTSQRSSRTTYTNTTGRAIVISVISAPSATGKTQLNLSINGDLVVRSAVPGSNTGDGTNAWVTAIVPPEGTYDVSSVSGSITNWAELR